jgi:hypothetical protein
MHDVILDRSIFHGEKFDQIKGSSLAEKCRTNRIRVWMTPPFLEETLQFVADGRERSAEHWRYITSLSGLRWFRPAEEIVAAELSGVPQPRRYYERDALVVSTLLERVEDFLSGCMDAEDYAKAQREVKALRERRMEFRERRKEIREEVEYGPYVFDQYYSENIDWLFKEGLMKHYVDSQDYLDVWRTWRDRCRFTESYTRAWIAVLFLPIVDRNLRIDANDRADAEQLAYLRWADIMVSDDTRFMHRCFGLLYPRGEKRLLTLREFLRIFDHLA